MALLKSRSHAGAPRPCTARCAAPRRMQRSAEAVWPPSGPRQRTASYCSDAAAWPSTAPPHLLLEHIRLAAPLPHQQLAQLGAAHGDPVAQGVERQRAQLLPGFHQGPALIKAEHRCWSTCQAGRGDAAPWSGPPHISSACGITWRLPCVLAPPLPAPAHLPMDSVCTVVRSGSCSSSKMPCEKPTASSPTPPCSTREGRYRISSHGRIGGAKMGVRAQRAGQGGLHLPGLLKARYAGRCKLLSHTCWTHTHLERGRRQLGAPLVEVVLLS